jgi:hypothetical protein
MAEDDPLDRPVTMREFNLLLQRFDKLDEDRAAEKKEREAEKKEREAERLSVETKKAKIEEEKANVWQKWNEGKTVEFLLLFFKVHQGNYHQPCVNSWHVKAD